MNRALILHHSRRGTTAAYAQEIADELTGRGIPVTVKPMYQASGAPVAEVDTIFLGCWTSGLFFFRQRPEPDWVRYLHELPDISNKEIVLFTTYKIVTGTMFSEMARHLPAGTRLSLVKIKSRSSRLTDTNMELFDLLTNTVRESRKHTAGASAGDTHDFFAFLKRKPCYAKLQ